MKLIQAIQDLYPPCNSYKKVICNKHPIWILSKSTANKMKDLSSLTTYQANHFPLLCHTCATSSHLQSCCLMQHLYHPMQNSNITVNQRIQAIDRNLTLSQWRETHWYAVDEKSRKNQTWIIDVDTRWSYEQWKWQK